MKRCAGSGFAMLVALLLCLVPEVADAQTPAPGEPLHTILLVRHGAYESDPGAGPLGPPLNTLGIAQARMVGTRIAGLRGGPDELLASPLLRAHQTARIVAESLPGSSPTIVPAVAECTPRMEQPAGSADENQARAECTARLDSIFDMLTTPRQAARRTVVVAHGNVIRYLATRAIGAPATLWPAMSIGHTSITRIVVGSDGIVQLTALGDLGHLPDNMQSGGTGLTAPPLAAPPPLEQ